KPCEGWRSSSTQVWLAWSLPQPIAMASHRKRCTTVAIAARMPSQPAVRAKPRVRADVAHERYGDDTTIIHEILVVAKNCSITAAGAAPELLELELIVTPALLHVCALPSFEIA